ncbi:MAG TPA: peptide chain release factor N(5)-glutamine methyltransferase [Acidimicrobiales bacterium]|nr:peptide chain release factor N(5)-glutamine methyltransferase [Acidimicrobiales bacterium]
MSGQDQRSWRDLRSGATSSLADPVTVARLLEEASGVSGAELMVHLDEAAPAAAARRMDLMVARLLAGEPLQHVLGHWGFRLLDLAVGPGALIPRPETEIVTELAIGALAGAESPVVVDLGTGTGAIALSIAVEVASATVYAVERSPAALQLASANLCGLGRAIAARVTLLSGDWYGALPGELRGRIDLVVSNPPYVSEAEWLGLDPVVKDHDPYDALVPGPIGTEAIEQIVEGAGDWLAVDGALVVEIAPSQASAVLEMATRCGFSDSRVASDLAGRERALVARR